MKNYQKENIKYKKIISYTAVILWMIVIFMFSADPADVSDGKSGLIIEIFNYIGLDLNSYLGQATNFIVRKAGHFTEYFILCILVFNALRYNFNKKKCLKIAIFFVFLYACSDEFHQLFVPGRSGQFRDVFIDTLGGILGGLIFFKFYKNK
ncbi:VanZ family protein [Haloimpatiens lingqiaonensis]|uniref:VanZ family protein n=1 Tax=Haloimpatiens lingqiaonensis TaxID=1380675 RepID=UPI0010FD9171|nr:VanZ family protein [Haloimpatiens lingqiaonensis]